MVFAKPLSIGDVWAHYKIAVIVILKAILLVKLLIRGGLINLVIVVIRHNIGAEDSKLVIIYGIMSLSLLTVQDLLTAWVCLLHIKRSYNNYITFILFQISKTAFSII